MYLACLINYLSGAIFRSRLLLRAGTAVGWAALAGGTLGLGLRWHESYEMGFGHAPLSNLYESLVFGAWCIMLVYLVLELRTRQRALGVFPALFAFLAMAYASFSTQTEIQPLVPALKSNWLIAHVVACFLGYAAFAISFGISVFYLATAKSSQNPHPKGMFALLPDRRTLDALNYQIIVFGFLWLSLGIITGSVWADQAWGAYWSWDPKETWSLITWLIYAAALHFRAMRGWRGRRVAWCSIVGFGCVLFTYFGVNFLLSGLHSYATQ
jgi:cytochrome c-type biogenesis protein CcsB